MTAGISLISTTTVGAAIDKYIDPFERHEEINIESSLSELGVAGIETGDI